jgi:hypothetical protein
MNARINAPMIIAVILLVVIVAGEAIVFTSGHDDYSTDVSLNGDSISYDINARGSHVYDVIVMQNSSDRPKDVAIYYDESYASNVESVSVAVGGRALDQKYYVEQMIDTLQLRDITNVRIVDAAGLRSIMTSNGDGHAVICLSGSLPKTVYDGTSDSPILKWISSGGRLYWAGNMIGAYYSDGNEVVPVGASGTALFLGSACVDDTVNQVHDSIDNGYRDAFSMQNNDTRYSPRLQEFPMGTHVLGIGYTDGYRASMTLVGLGDGFVCIAGGDYSNFQRIDLAQVLAAGISPDTLLGEWYHGSVSGHASGKVQAGDHVYICLGGYFPVYGELHEVA